MGFMRLKPLATCEVEGAAAYGKGRPATAVPYPQWKGVVSARKHAAWLRGWREARRVALAAKKGAP
jgi:ribosome modulation factor